MTLRAETGTLLRHPDRFYIGGEWVEPSSTDRIGVIDSATEEEFLTVAEARTADVDRAVAAARLAFDDGPWPRFSPTRRAEFLRAMADGLRKRGGDIAQFWPRESGVLHAVAQNAAPRSAGLYEFYAGLADTFSFEEPATPMAGEFGLLVREPVGVVGAIIPWNGPQITMTTKIVPALLAGCTVILKSSPEAPAEGYIIAEIAEDVGLPAGVLNVLTADREVSELLVRDPRVDKITFTGSTAAGRRIGSICGDRVARCTLELGGKSAAVILDDMDIATAATTLARAECNLTGQVCASLTRVVVTKGRHDAMVEALTAEFAAVRVGDPFTPSSEMGPLVSDRQRDRVLGYIEKGKAEGAVLATGGGPPAHLSRGFYVEPTVFGHVDNSSSIAQEEIFGPVLSVIPSDSEEDSIRIANDTVYGLNASVFTNDPDRAREIARRLKSGTVGHNAPRVDLHIAFGGFKQSGIGREGGVEGLLPFLETKTVVLQGRPSGYR